jgi:hypothetical protein
VLLTNNFIEALWAQARRKWSLTTQAIVHRCCKKIFGVSHRTRH